MRVTTEGEDLQEREIRRLAEAQAGAEAKLALTEAALDGAVKRADAAEAEVLRLTAALEVLDRHSLPRLSELPLVEVAPEVPLGGAALDVLRAAIDDGIEESRVWANGVLHPDELVPA